MMRFQKEKLKMHEFPRPTKFNSFSPLWFTYYRVYGSLEWALRNALSELKTETYGFSPMACVAVFRRRKLLPTALT